MMSSNQSSSWIFVAATLLLVVMLGGVIFANGTYWLKQPGSETQLGVGSNNPSSSPIIQEVIVSSPMVVGKPASEAASPTKDSNTPSRSGTIICLPKKNTTGPQTLECAFGLQTSEGNYGLNDTDSTYANISGVEMGVEVTVYGRIKPQTDQIYDTLGVIEVVKIEKN